MNWKPLLAARETDTHFVIEGRHAVERLLDSSYEVEKVIEIGLDLSREEASQLLGFKFHRSHLAIAKKPEQQPPLSVFKEGPVVILPEIADPGNLGTIIRNTAALGGAGLLLGKGASPFNAKAVRASAGALFRLPVRKSPDLIADLHELAESRTVIGTYLGSDALPFDQLPRIDRPVALILGPEDFGISQEIRDLCHHLSYIPMARNIDSLNVASSSAIFLQALR
ncbi:MAG: RNA methyltransferase [Akkermansiaceae bacterium]|nr:RNA methyltransferase [Akkermansiaceae bacterium]